MLKNRVVLITGAARGIGKAAATLFAEQQATLAINDCDEQELVKTVKQIKKYGVNCVGFACDLLKPEAPKQLVSDVIATFGKVDVLVNNAGFTWDKMAHKMTDQQFQTILDIHTLVPFRLIRELSPYMREKGKQEKAEGKQPQDRCIINISSTSGLHGNIGQVNYATAKMGIVGLTKTIAREWGPFGVRCNAVAFGFINTRLTQHKSKGEQIEINGKHVDLGIPNNIEDTISMINCLHAVGTPEQAAGGILMMALPYASFITGHTLEVTGGQGI